MKYFVQMPFVIRFLFPKIIWKGEGQEKVVYLTFDDGPNAEITPKILNILEHNHIKATFFCLGGKVKENQAIYHRIIEEGHAVGNHSYAHPEAWKISHKDFMRDIEEASTLIDSKLFRPPYGRLKWKDYQVLKKRFKIVLWSIMPGDWDRNIDEKKLLKRMKKHLSPAAIYVLHDTEKSFGKLETVLPIFIKFAEDQGYSFGVLK